MSNKQEPTNSYLFQLIVSKSTNNIKRVFGNLICLSWLCKVGDNFLVKNLYLQRSGFSKGVKQILKKLQNLSSKCSLRPYWIHLCPNLQQRDFPHLPYFLSF